MSCSLSSLCDSDDATDADACNILKALSNLSSFILFLLFRGGGFEGGGIRSKFSTEGGGVWFPFSAVSCKTVSAGGASLSSDESELSFPNN